MSNRRTRDDINHNINGALREAARPHPRGVRRPCVRCGKKHKTRAENIACVKRMKEGKL